MSGDRKKTNNNIASELERLQQQVFELEKEKTERKRSEKIQDQDLDMYVTMVESAASGILIGDFETKEIKYANPAACDMFGYSRKDLMYIKVMDLHPEKDLESVISEFEAQGRGEKTLSANLPCQRKDGTVFYCDINTARATVGGRACNVGFFTDVTNRKNTEDKVRVLSLIAEQVFDSVTITDLDFKIIFTNQAFCRLYGYNRKELIGKSPDILNAEPEFEKIQEDIYRHISTGRMWRGEVTNRRKDGTKFPCELTVFPLYNEEGKAFAYAGSQRDITDRKHAEEEKRELERRVQHAQKLESLGVLAGGIAHDFNNLLTGILGHTELALLDLSPQSPIRKGIEEIQRTTLRAADLAEQMLAYSGKGKFVTQLLNLNALVGDHLDLLKVSISKTAKMELSLDRNIPSIEGDPTQLRQVTMNMVTNASDALGDNEGVISVSSGVRECDRDYLHQAYTHDKIAEGKYVYLEVRDTGCGMDEKTKGKLFDPFFTTKFTGRGLGLSALLGIVKGHKGAVKVRSEPGRGTTFRVLFPAVELPAQTQERGSGMVEDRTVSDTILLVDDEEAVLNVGKPMLERIGLNVVTARDGVEAVDIFKSMPDQIACVILDLTMPKMGGEATFDELRRIRSDVRIILCSGFTEDEVTERFAGKGLSGVIQKPFLYKVLTGKVLYALDS